MSAFDDVVAASQRRPVRGLVTAGLVAVAGVLVRRAERLLGLPRGRVVTAVASRPRKACCRGPLSGCTSC